MEQQHTSHPKTIQARSNAAAMDSKDGSFQFPSLGGPAAQMKATIQSGAYMTVQRQTHASVFGNTPTTQLMHGKDEEKVQRMAKDEEVQRMAIDTAVPAETVQRAAKGDNTTGMPDNLKSGIESLSGMSMNDVKVHYNSAKPATLQAHAYTQGNQIHVASGQEKHLAHEAWHVVQQKQGRVKPTMQMKGTPINDNRGLEKEADVMGSKAAQMKFQEGAVQRKANEQANPSPETTQLKKGGRKSQTHHGANQASHRNANIAGNLAAVSQQQMQIIQQPGHTNRRDAARQARQQLGVTAKGKAKK